jgi:hypothetical protein
MVDNTHYLQPSGVHENRHGRPSSIRRSAGDTSCGTLWHFGANTRSIGDIERRHFRRMIHRRT